MVSFYDFNCYLESGRWELPVQNEGWAARLAGPLAVGLSTFLPAAMPSAAPQAMAQQPSGPGGMTALPKVDPKPIVRFIEIPWNPENRAFFARDAKKLIGDKAINKAREAGGNVFRIEIRHEPTEVLYANGAWNNKKVAQLMTRPKTQDQQGRTVVNVKVAIYIVR